MDGWAAVTAETTGRDFGFPFFFPFGLDIHRRIPVGRFIVPSEWVPRR